MSRLNSIIAKATYYNSMNVNFKIMRIDWVNTENHYYEIWNIRDGLDVDEDTIDGFFSHYEIAVFCNYNDIDSIEVNFLNEEEFMELF